MSADFCITDDFQLHLFILLTLEAVVKVKDKSCFPRLGKRVAMNGGALGRGQLGLYAITVEEYGIISRFCLLPPVRERRGVCHLLALLPHRMIVLTAHGGHQQHIAIITATRSTEVRVRESVNGGIGIVITGTSIPLKDARVGARLNHPVGYHCARIGMSVPPRTDKRIYVRCIVFP